MTKDIFRANVREICKLRELKLGEVEREAKVCTGFLSRETQGLSLDNALKLSRTLNVSVDDLVDPDYLKKSKIAIREKKLRELQEREAQIKREIEELENAD